jgi:hypothetical protein
MALARAKQRGELADTNPLGKVGVDMCDQQSRLPGQQTSGCGAPPFGGQPWAPRPDALLSLKKLDGTRNVETGSFAVTVARFVCGFNELRRDN